MAENDDVPGSPDRDSAPAPEQQPAQQPEQQPVLKTRWRDRAWTFRAMLAVALASLVIGGVAGGVIGAVAGSDDRDDHYRMGPWGPGMQMPPGQRGRGRRDFGGPGGPGWRWNDGPQQAPDLTPYGTPSPSAPSSTPSPGSTG